MHTTEADILLYLENKLNAASAEEIKTHFSICGHCREQLVAILRLPAVIESGEAPPLDTEVYARALKLGAQKRSTLFRFSLPPLGKLALAALAFIAAGISYFFLTQTPTPSRFRDRAPATQAFTMHPPEGGVVKQSIPTFSWSAMKNSVGYQLTLYRDNGTMLWQGTSRDTSLISPADIALLRGKTYLWKVAAFYPDRSNYESKLNAFVYSP